MGTNLNQVFILNNANLETGTNFASPTAGDVGIWTLDGTNHYTAVTEPLYQTTFSPLDTDIVTGTPAPSEAPPDSPTYQTENPIPQNSSLTKSPAPPNHSGSNSSTPAAKP